jgi:hypothetical protein
MMRAVLLAAAFALAGPAAAEPDAAPTPGAGMDVLHYQVKLRPYLLGRSLSGETEITVRSTTEPLRELVFSGNALSMDFATVDGRPVRAELRDRGWVIALPRPLARVGRRCCGRATTACPGAA